LPRIQYINNKFHQKSLRKIEEGIKIIDEYKEAELTLTIRQLYYKFVSKNLIINTDLEYIKFSQLFSKARLTGLIDWHSIEDRTRFVRRLSHFSTPKEILEATLQSYRNNKWWNQPKYVEVWIEKDALMGVISDVCNKYDTPYFSRRGYTSQSEMWNASQRINRYLQLGRNVYILHLGDHDPSGLDMTMDIKDKLDMFTGYNRNLRIKRLALSMEQIIKYKAPPNYTKVKGRRSQKYIDEYGNDCWELDALEPKVIIKLIETNIKKLINKQKWDEALHDEQIDDRFLEKHLNPIINGMVLNRGYQ